MSKLDLRNALQIRAPGGEILKLRGPGFTWERLIEQNLSPMPELLTASRINIIGASFMAYPALSNIQTFAANLGFSGTVQNYAVAGSRLTTASMPQTDDAEAADAAALDEGGNLYILDLGGNDVTESRPYPKSETAISTALSAWVDRIKAAGNIPIILPLTKRFYPESPVVTDDPSSDQYGSLPYHENIWLPEMVAETPDWVVGGESYIDNYNLTARTRALLSTDGVHFTNANNYPAYVFGMIARRAAGLPQEPNWAGKTLNISFKGSTQYAETLLVAKYQTSNTQQVIGGRFADGEIVPGAFVFTNPVRAASSSPTAPASRFVFDGDERFNVLEMFGRAMTTIGGNPTITIGGLPAGHTVTVHVLCATTSNAADRITNVTMEGQSILVDGKTTATSNVGHFSPVVIPTSGELVITAAAAEGSTYGYLNAVSIDFN